MTSPRQTEANRRNATRSTGPVTEEGKRRSRRNAVRHGLTAETVVDVLEDPEDYRAFEAAVSADFNPETAVERELVLRLASLLWRLRRSTAIEAGLLELAADADRPSSEPPVALSKEGQIVVHMPQLRLAAGADSDSWTDPGPARERLAQHGDDADAEPTSTRQRITVPAAIAGRFLRLAATDNGAFERIGRYETALWRQACQTLFMLEVLRRQNLDLKWLPRRSHFGSRNSLTRSIFASHDRS